MSPLVSIDSTEQFVFVTPSHARDLQHVRRQRRCFVETGTEIPHYIIVNSEDRPLFETMLGESGGNVTLLTTADVLPKWVEAKRGTPYRRRDPRHWIFPRRISGWWIQQFVKLLAPEITKARCFACLDSDTCPIREVSADDFFDPDERLHLWATRGDSTLTEAIWTNRSYQALSQSTDVPVHRFVQNPVPMSSEIVRRMRAELERLHGRSWIEVFLKFQLTEYATYGAFALHKGLDQVSPKDVNPLSRSLWFREDAAELPRIVEEIRRDVECKFLCVQSHLNLPNDRADRLYAEVIGACTPLAVA